MISIVVCSRTKELNAEFNENISLTIGTAFELICIDNSANDYSIFSAYNEGFKRSKYPYICFLHEDIYIYTNDWGKRLTEHLQQPKAGIIGIAGGDVATRIPASWLVEGVSICITESDKNHPKNKKSICQPAGFNGIRRSAILLDGVFLAMKREVMEKFSFDEELGGFHGYDLDISIQSVIAGYTNFVMYDIEVEHYSRGNRNETYYHNLIKVFRKWEKYLPIFGNNISEEQKLNIHRIEKKRLIKLTKSMARTGFSYKEIATEIKYFSNRANLKGNDNKLLTIYIRVFLTRLTERPLLLFK